MKFYQLNKQESYFQCVPLPKLKSKKNVFNSDNKTVKEVEETDQNLASKLYKQVLEKMDKLIDQNLDSTKNSISIETIKDFFF